MKNRITPLTIIILQQKVNEFFCLQAMRGILQAESHHPDLSQHDSFVCIILSHGEQGTVFSADGKRITYDEIMRYFNGEKCPALLEKPKMIFIQACQGSK